MDSIKDVIENIDANFNRFKTAQTFVCIHTGRFDGPATPPELVKGTRLFSTGDSRVEFPVVRSRILEIATEGLDALYREYIAYIEANVENGILGKVEAEKQKLRLASEIDWMANNPPNFKTVTPSSPLR